MLDFTSRVSDLMTSVTDHNVPQILFGDLNIYIDFEYPIELLRGIFHRFFNLSYRHIMWQVMTSTSQVDVTMSGSLTKKKY